MNLTKTFLPQKPLIQDTSRSVLNKVNLSATSEYLKGLAEIGLVHRERAGRLVNYTPDF